MRTMSGTRGAMMLAGVLVVAGVAALVYAPENKTAIKVGMLVVGVVIGAVTWLWARSRR
jgi:hypothetical protein